MCVCGGALCKHAVIALEANAGQCDALKGLESAGVILSFSPQSYICHLNQTPAQSRGHIYVYNDIRYDFPIVYHKTPWHRD